MGCPFVVPVGQQDEFGGSALGDVAEADAAVLGGGVEVDRCRPCRPLVGGAGDGGAAGDDVIAGGSGVGDPQVPVRGLVHRHRPVVVAVRSGVLPDGHRRQRLRERGVDRVGVGARAVGQPVQVGGGGVGVEDVELGVGLVPHTLGPGRGAGVEVRPVRRCPRQPFGHLVGLAAARRVGEDAVPAGLVAVPPVGDDHRLVPDPRRPGEPSGVGVGDDLLGADDDRRCGHRGGHDPGAHGVLSNNVAAITTARRALLGASGQVR